MHTAILFCFVIIILLLFAVSCDSFAYVIQGHLNGTRPITQMSMCYPGSDNALDRWPVLTWWRHQMETFSALLALCAGNSPVPVNSPHKGQWRGALMFSLICVRINDWVNNREVGDVRRHRGHYDVSVMNHSCYKRDPNGLWNNPEGRWKNLAVPNKKKAQ